MKIEQIINCSFDRWYNRFKHITFKSEIIPIPNEVLDYLRSDSTIILPKSCQNELDIDLNNNQSDFSDDDSTDWTEQEEIEYPDFSEFDKKITEALKIFRNKVLIKLNWSSPKDAYWALNKLSCDRLSDIYIQLRSSDFINHDLTQAFDECEDKDANNETIKNFQYNLILRDWISINPNMEFRCFVHKNVLVGISQRDCRSFFQVLLDNRQEILKRIQEFYINNIHEKFFDESYVFDVCSGKKTIKLMDFNPFGKITDTLLYSWDEFEKLLPSTDGKLSDSLELRVIEDNYGIFNNQYSIYGQPKDSLEAFLNSESVNTEAENLASLIKENMDLQKKEDQTENNIDTIDS